MRKLMLVMVMGIMATAAGVAIQAQGKLPKCSMTLCRSVGCSPDVLCASGAHVKTCAEICHVR
jgi:hypothetical protein